MKPQTSNDSRQVVINGIKLAFLEWPGERGPIICLPHLTGHKGSFINLAKRLSPTYRVIALDLRGRGDSDKPEDGYGFAYHTRDILAFAEARKIDQFTLIGHSFGATAATYLASIASKRVAAVALLDGGADPKEETLRSMYPTIQRLSRVHPSLNDYLAAMQALSFHQPWSAALEQYFAEDVDTLPDGSVRSKSSAAAIERDLDQHFMYSMCLHFPALRCPALFIRPMLGLTGDKGHVFSEAEATAIVRHIPRGRRADAPEANHYTMLIHDEPPVVEPIKNFLAEVYSVA